MRHRERTLTTWRRELCHHRSLDLIAVLMEVMRRWTNRRHLLMLLLLLLVLRLHKRSERRMLLAFAFCRR